MQFPVGELHFYFAKQPGFLNLSFNFYIFRASISTVSTTFCSSGKFLIVKMPWHNISIITGNRPYAKEKAPGKTNDHRSRCGGHECRARILVGY